MDGVIWRNKVPIGNLQAIFQRINETGFKYAFATNNSTKTVASYVDLLNGLGIPVIGDQVFTSGLVTAHILLSTLSPGSELYVIGMPGLMETLTEKGFEVGFNSPAAVVVGLDETLTYEKLKIAVSLVMNDLPFFGTNPDVAIPTPDGLHPGAGSILAAIESASGVSPKIIGKPQPTIFECALEFLQTSPAETLVIGDRLSTDIAGGQVAGCQTGLVLSGVTEFNEAITWRPKIDFISDDLASLVEALFE